MRLAAAAALLLLLASLCDLLQAAPEVGQLLAMRRKRPQSGQEDLFLLLLASNSAASSLSGPLGALVGPLSGPLSGLISAQVPSWAQSLEDASVEVGQVTDPAQLLASLFGADHSNSILDLMDDALAWLGLIERRLEPRRL